jgi:Ca-activated chloride channel family protein
MTFIWPLMFVLLIFVPAAVVYYLILQKRRGRIAANFGKFGLVANAAGQRPGFRRHIPPIIFLVGLTILVVSLARPQMMLTLPRVEGTVILAFDVSGSMAADDFQPTRMEAAKKAAREFVQLMPRTVNIGVVAFSDNGFSMQVPTNDVDMINAAINRLTPQRGTSLAHGITASLSLINANKGDSAKLYSSLVPTPTTEPTPMPKGTYTPAVIVLLTDGENNENPNPLDAAHAAADRGVRIYTVGVGSPAGTTLHVNGFTVHTQLDEQTLQLISQISDGAYFNAETDQDLVNIYSNLTPQLQLKPENTEVTSVFAGGSIIVLLIGGFLSLLWFSRMP